MTLMGDAPVLARPDSIYYAGAWQPPNSSEFFEVKDSTTEESFLSVPAADRNDIDRAIRSARSTFDEGSWASLQPHERATYLEAVADALDERCEAMASHWPRETGILHTHARAMVPGYVDVWRQYARLADSFEFRKMVTPTNGGAFGQIVREPVGVVGAIIPWNVPPMMVAHKVAPALLAGCTVILKASPEAPTAAYLAAEAAHAAGLPAGVLNVVTADRDVSETLVTDPRVDKITFTGSTAAGQRIGMLMGSRIGRCTLELGGKSAALVLDDYDLETAADTLANRQCVLSGQVCAALTRIIIQSDRHDDMVDALAAHFDRVRIGDPFDANVDMGPLASKQQLDRVKSYIATGSREGARIASGGGVPADVERGYFIEPTVFANVDNSSTIAQEEIFGPVLSVIPARDERDAISLANASDYGLNASVFSHDTERAYRIARQLRSGTVGHNAQRTDFGIAFGGFKQSGLGREGGAEGLMSYLETKTIILNADPAQVNG